MEKNNEKNIKYTFSDPPMLIKFRDDETISTSGLGRAVEVGSYGKSATETTKLGVTATDSGTPASR